MSRYRVMRTQSMDVVLTDDDYAEAASYGDGAEDAAAEIAMAMPESSWNTDDLEVIEIS